MLIKNENDTRFTTITDAEITSLYQKVPQQFGGFLLEISYKEEENDIFPHYLNINIDGRNFLTELDKLEKDNSLRLLFTRGMGDIDLFFKNKNEFIIRFSPNEGSIIYISFKKKEFEKLLSWVKLNK